MGFSAQNCSLPEDVGTESPKWKGPSARTLQVRQSCGCCSDPALGCSTHGSGRSTHGRGLCRGARLWEDRAQPGTHLPGWSGYLCLQYASSDAYTFSRNASTSAGLERPFESERQQKDHQPKTSRLSRQAGTPCAFPSPLHPSQHHQTKVWMQGLNARNLGQYLTPPRERSSPERFAL